MDFINPIFRYSILKDRFSWKSGFLFLEIDFNFLESIFKDKKYPNRFQKKRNKFLRWFYMFLFLDDLLITKEEAEFLGLVFQESDLMGVENEINQ